MTLSARLGSRDSDPERPGPGTDDEGLNTIAEVDARIVAFYLPQYHPVRENSEWWGDGFTDWTNVRKAESLFEGHDQPRIPTSLGYYDLRDPDVHHAQATLARQHGVSAFCYYAYWFGGRRLLEQPLDLVGANPDLAMPYAICWANEPWSRRWDGSESEVLMPQDHSPERDGAFIDDMATHLADPRYLRIDGRPLLLIYRAGLLVDPLRTTDMLRERAVRLGLGELYLTMAQTFGAWEPLGYGFDAAVEFPPHNLGVEAAAAPQRNLFSARTSVATAAGYEEAARVSLSRAVPQFPWFRGVMPGWDNTPRRGARGTVYLGASPDTFRRWLEEVLRCTYLFRPPGERLVFINGWNEWAEGAYLEPDSTFGDAYLRAISDALRTIGPFAEETARLLAAGPRSGGLLDDVRRAWSRSPMRPIVPGAV